MNQVTHSHPPYTSSVTTVTTMNDTMMTDVLSDDPSSPESSFDTADLMGDCHDDVTSQLAAAGPIGVAAAAAIASNRKKKRPHQFETNPSIRKRQQTRLLRKLKSVLDEYTTRVGQQAILLAVTPAKNRESAQSYKVFGSQPLESVVRNCRNEIMQELDQVLAQQTPASHVENSHLFELPSLVVDGMPTGLDKMTQAQLRMFIPEMLKFSTGRSKPGWGKPDCRPVWWPADLPWANVRCDVRSEEEKKRVSWTHALRTIVRNCYKHHGREDLLPAFTDEPPTHNQYNTVMQTINNPDGTLSIIHIDTSAALQSGSHQMVTLADGSQAAVVQALTSEEVHSLTGGSGNPGGDLADEMTTVAEATLHQDGSIILADASVLTSDSSMVHIPVTMYQTVVSNMNHLENGQNLTIHVQGSKSPEANVPPASTQTVEIMAE